MSTQRTTAFNTLLGLACLAAVSWTMIATGRFLVSSFVGLNPNVAAAIVAAFATVTVSVLTVVVGKQIEAGALLTKEHREKKVPVYEEFIQFWFKHQFAAKLGETPLTHEEITRFLSNYTQRIMVWGADDVIAAWVKCRYSAIDATRPADANTVLYNYERLVLAMRKDLGHKNRGFKQGDILRLFINDMNAKPPEAGQG